MEEEAAARGKKCDSTGVGPAEELRSKKQEAITADQMWTARC